MNSLKYLLLCTFLFAATVVGDPIYVSGSGSTTTFQEALQEAFLLSGSNGADSVSLTISQFFVNSPFGLVPPLQGNSLGSTGLLTLDGVSSPFFDFYLPNGGAGFVEILSSNSNAVVLAHQDMFGDVVNTGQVDTGTSLIRSFDILPINIPEPSTASLFLVGLVGWGAVRCRTT